MKNEINVKNESTHFESETSDLPLDECSSQVTTPLSPVYCMYDELLRILEKGDAQERKEEVHALRSSDFIYMKFPLNSFT